MMPSASPELYFNMHQFSELKLGARGNDAETTRAVAQQFEGLFIQLMLKNMRAAVVTDPSQHSNDLQFYQEMYDKQMAQQMARAGGIGLGDLLQRQLGGGDSERQQSAAIAGKALPEYRLPTTQGSMPLKVMDYIASNPAVKAHQLNDSAVEDVAPVNASAPLSSKSIKPFYGWQKPADFIRDLWPHAQQASNSLGVSAEALVAQSALETGWGRYAMKKPDGSVAFNLFGIKAGADWAGQRVAHATLEYREGVMQQERAVFRAYDTVADAMEDYVDFVQSRSHYAAALQHQGSDAHYLRGLQSGGYATDPQYADKILRIMDGDTLGEALAQVALASVDLT